MRGRGVLWLFCFLALTACAEETFQGAPEAALDEGAPLDPTGKADGGEPVPAYDPLASSMSLEHDFAVMFAPDDPVNTVEVSLIDAVIEARAEDSADYAEGQNPFRIRYAVYNLRNPRIVERLIDAEAAGVDVQILIEADQLSEAKTWNTADETLAAAGFEVVPDHAALNEDPTADTSRARADLIGIDRSGLMHLKARLYETPASRALLTGSLNPGDNAMLNEETLHLVREPRVIDRYAAAYEAILDDRRFDNAWDEAAAVNVLFSPTASGPRPGSRLLDWIAEEEEQILLMVFSLRDVSASGHSQSLVDLLIAKARDGVPVYVITDRKQSDGVDGEGNRRWRDDGTEDRLRAGGVTVYEAINTAGPFNAMHHKVGVFGRSRVRVVTDAANWTYSALGSSSRTSRNVESMLFIDTALMPSPHVGHRYLAQWLRVLERYAPQTPDAPDFQAVYGALSAEPGWPAVPVLFDVTRAETAWGERVHVRGDHDSLSNWGQLGPGLPLETDEARYPDWHTPEAALMPLGAPFLWKAVALFEDGRVRWESGGDRAGRAMPSALLDPERYTPGASLHQGAWR